jgi:hypothetical protein
MESKIVYFEKPGNHTDEVLQLVKQRAQELGIKTAVVASTAGATAVKAAGALEGLKVIAVSHSDGFKEPNTQEFTEENKKALESKGGVLLTATHAMGGLSRALGQGSIETAPRTYVIGDVVAHTLRIFSQGMKVVCEVAAMAADAGLVRTDEDTIVIAGTGSADTGRGADTAVVIKPAYAHEFFDMRVKEILCKPLSR